jgi:hypothetical protein
MRSFIAIALLAQLVTPLARAEAPRPSGAASATQPVSPTEIDAKVYYEKAMRLQVDGKAAEARVLYQRVIIDYPKTSYAPVAKTKLAEIDATFRPEAEPSGIYSSGRIEVISGDSMLWLGYGLLMPLLFTDRAEDWSKSALWAGLGAGVAAGVTAALATRARAIPDGWADLHLFSQMWGSWNAFGIYTLAAAGSPFADHYTGWSAAGIVGSVLGGAVLGLGTSLLLKDQLSIPRGKAEFIIGSAGWGSIIGFSAALLAAGEEIRLKPAVGAILGGGDGALILSSLFAPRWTKTRVSFVNLIGLGGVTLGDAIAFSARLENIRAYGGISLGCTLAGLAIGMLVTSGMPDDRADAERHAMAPPALVTYDGSFDFGVPVPRLLTSATSNGKPALGLSADLFGAVF